MDLWKSGETPLWREDVKNQLIPNITPFISDGAKSAVIICPGGGYCLKSVEHEGVAVAQWLCSIGVSAFVLDYRVYPYNFPAMQLDARRAVRYVRYHAKEYGIDKDKIGILGFSAGGHLAASTGIIFDDYGEPALDDIDKEDFKPNFMILCYPVITLDDKYTHSGTKRALLGRNYEEALADKLSCEKRVTKDAVPAFIWHTATDDAVSVFNSLNLAAALRENGVPFELDIFPEGPHGLGLAPDYADIKDWTRRCEIWMRKRNLI